MRAKNYTYYTNDQDTLKRLGEEYRFIGRDYKVYEDRIVVFALPRSKKAVKVDPKAVEAKPERYSKRERDFG